MIRLRRCDWRLMAAMVLGLLFCSGCLMVPIPTGEHDNKTLPGRTNITPEVLGTLQPGVSTREAVLLQLGVPDGVFDNGRKFVYLWTKSVGYFLWAVGSQTAAGGGLETVGKGYVLMIDLDDAGIVQRHEILSKNNWTHFTGPRIDTVNFPDEMKNPERRPQTIPAAP